MPIHTVILPLSALKQQEKYPQSIRVAEVCHIITATAPTEASENKSTKDPDVRKLVLRDARQSCCTSFAINNNSEMAAMEFDVLGTFPSCREHHFS